MKRRNRPIMSYVDYIEKQNQKYRNVLAVLAAVLSIIGIFYVLSNTNF